MRVLLDENVPYEVKGWLASATIPAIPVDHVHDLEFASQTDEFLYAWAERNEALIITFDEDFADQRRFPVGGRCGVIRLRVEPTTHENACAALERLMSRFKLAEFLGKLAIVDERRIRILG